MGGDDPLFANLEDLKFDFADITDVDSLLQVFEGSVRPDLLELLRNKGESQQM